VGEWDSDDIRGHNRAVFPLNWKGGGFRDRLVYRHLKGELQRAAEGESWNGVAPIA